MARTISSAETATGGEHPRIARPLLTRAELEVLAAVEDLLDELGYAPTYRDILERLGWSSRGSLHQYLERLREKGALVGRGRALRVASR